jgi:ferric-dicitrate binding protein FerR (iron transport regulator)
VLSLRFYLPTVSFCLALGMCAVAQADSCACPVITCDELCEVKESLSFYSEKCPNSTKTRSCSRPVCLKLEPVTAQCKAREASAPAEAPPSMKSAKAAAAAAAVKAVAAVVRKVGLVESVRGQAWSIREGSASDRPLSEGALINEKDRLRTGADSQLEVRFEDGNLIALGPNSELVVSEVTFSSDPQYRSVLLNLKKGKVRSDVKVRYANPRKGFRVVTKGAKAGARGTEFLVEYVEASAGTDDSSGEKNETVVTTFTGQVELSSLTEPELIPVLVDAEMQARFIEPSDPAGPGSLMAAQRLSRKELQRLSDGRVATEDVPPSRAPVCSDPAARFNECRWTCQNNPRGEATCRSDLPGVKCVRSVCKANGRWADFQRQPASSGYKCHGAAEVVGLCDF